MEVTGKRILILRACGHSDESNECSAILTQAKLYGMLVDDGCPKSNQEVVALLNTGQKYDYIYLSSHGNSAGFNSTDSAIEFSWIDFAVEICNSECLNEHCVVMLSCCRGGLNEVAYTLFDTCDKIDYIIGPRQSLSSADMLIAFNIFLFNLENRNVDPITACEKIKSGADLRFKSFDREETLSEPGFLMWQSRDDDE